MGARVGREPGGRVSFVKKGAVINEATHVALGWLDEHVPRLRFKQG